MRLRIKYPDTNGYKNYGGRGIKICERWESYINFREDMGPTFVVGLTIDRVDPNGDYCFENCKWATKLEQQRSKRRHLKYNGELVVDYAKRIVKKYSTVVNYLRRKDLLDKNDS